MLNVSNLFFPYISLVNSLKSAESVNISFDIIMEKANSKDFVGF